MQKKNQRVNAKEASARIQGRKSQPLKSLIHGDWNQNLRTEPAASNRLGDGSMRYKYYAKCKLHDTPEV